MSYETPDADMVSSNSISIEIFDQKKTADGIASNGLASRTSVLPESSDERESTKQLR